MENKKSATHPLTCGRGIFESGKKKLQIQKYLDTKLWPGPYLPRANIAHDLSLGGSEMNSGS